MTPDEIILLCRERFGEKVGAGFIDKHPRIHVEAVDWRAIAEFMHGDSRLRLDWLANLSGVD